MSIMAQRLGDSRTFAFVAATVLVLGCGSQSTEPETAATDQNEPSRHIDLEGASNFRDLGGYATSDGRKVLWRQVFRTGELGRLSDDDVATLDKLDINTVVIFLLPEEIEKHGPDRLPPGVNLIHDPITGERSTELSLTAHQAISSGNFDILPAEINLEIHAVLMDEAKDQYARLLRTLADEANHPVAFHCSGGIHRTGTAAAILLSALGVPWETIREDYLLTNTVTQAETAETLLKLRAKAAQSRGVDPENVDMTNVEAFYKVEAAYIDGALAAAEEEYGSMEGYIRKGLGLSDQEITALRNALLE